MLNPAHHPTPQLIHINPVTNKNNRTTLGFQFGKAWVILGFQDNNLNQMKFDATVIVLRSPYLCQRNRFGHNILKRSSVILSWRSPTDLQWFRGRKMPHQKSVASVKHLLRPSDEWMCHPDDADEGWCHPDLTAVPPAGSMGAISKHQPSRPLTFQPLASLWKMLPQPNTLDLFEKRGKHLLGVSEPAHSFLKKIEKIILSKCPAKVNGSCFFSTA